MGLTPRYADHHGLMTAGPKALETVVTYLQMTAAPVSAPPPPPARAHAILKAEAVPLSFYRYLYGTVGSSVLWWERIVMPDDELRAALDEETRDVFVLYVGGVPAGYYELSDIDGEIELAYFGLIPDFIGQGFGAYLLRAAIDEAWRRGPKRMWLHTCTFDHPQALPNYQRAGFEPYKQETQIVTDPKVVAMLEK